MIQINRVIFLVLAVLLLFFLIYRLFEPFLLPLVVGALLAISTNAIQEIISQKIKNKTLITILMTLLLVALFFSPLLFFIAKTVEISKNINPDMMIDIYNKFIAIVKDISSTHNIFGDTLVQFFDTINIKELLTKTLRTGSVIGLSSIGFVFELGLIIVFYAIFVYSSQGLVDYLKSLFPITADEKQELFCGLSDTMGVVFYSILATALLEGFLFGVFVINFGYDGVLMGVLYGFTSLIPIVGGIIMWLPLVVIEASSGNWADALYITIYTIVVISIFADTILKPLIIKYINHNIVKKPTKINELVVFFSIVAGLGAFGFWGMILGPALVTIFLLILDIIKKRNQNIT